MKWKCFANHKEFCQQRCPVPEPACEQMEPLPRFLKSLSRTHFNPGISSSSYPLACAYLGGAGEVGESWNEELSRPLLDKTSATCGLRAGGHIPRAPGPGCLERGRAHSSWPRWRAVRAWAPADTCRRPSRDSGGTEAGSSPTGKFLQEVRVQYVHLGHTPTLIPVNPPRGTQANPGKKSVGLRLCLRAEHSARRQTFVDSATAFD